MASVLTPLGRRRIYLATLLSVGSWGLLQVLAPPAHGPWTPAMSRAAERMAYGIRRTAAHCGENDIPIEAVLDPNGTCLVGPMYTPLFTTQGNLEAKRTTLSPDMAGLMVHLLREAGVREGDAVAVGASGSFPGLLLATLVAVEAVGAEPRVILSLGSSSYGASRPDLDLLDLFGIWREAGLVSGSPLAVSLGGGRDVGWGFEEGFRDGLRRRIRARGGALLDEAELEANVAARMALYGPVALFVNIGGAEANLGTSPRILTVPPGLSRQLELPPEEERGVLYTMAAGGTPILHLLHIRGLTGAFGLPWDPVPLPPVASTPLVTGATAKPGIFWALSGVYLSALLTLLAWPPGILSHGAAKPHMS